MSHIKIFYGIFTILLATLTFTACSSDGDNEHANPDIPREIVGNWIYDDSREPEIYSFKKNGDVIFQSAYIDYDDEWVLEYIRGTYRISGKKLIITLEYDDKDYEDVYNYRIKDDKDYEDVYNYRIKDDKLTLNDESGSGSVNGSFITYTRTSYESLEDYLEYED